ncbi:MAG TPA: hypothetical protein VJS92_07370 [Candidatus Polarisedimenticolaceae bacterium]|nr:hypothetical protein [Candidatus Polarisedimenticolaceae bacterium]
MRGDGKRWARALAALVLGGGVGPLVAAGDESVLYLVGASSSIRRGCFPPCDCPRVEHALHGTFALSLASDEPSFRLYAISAARWSTTPAAEFLLRSGSYRLEDEPPAARLTLDVVLDGMPAEQLTGEQPWRDATSPAIDVELSAHGGVCLDTVLELHARPAIFLEVERGGFSWNALPRAAGYDVVLGDLLALRRSGSFAQAKVSCLARHLTKTVLDYADEPAPASGFWLLVRDSSFDLDDAAQGGSRDAGIAAALAACP